MRALTRRGGGSLQPWSGGGGLAPMMSMLEALRSDFDRLLGSPEALLPMAGGLTSDISAFVPPVDIQEKDNQYLVTAEIPGIDPKDIDVRLEGRNLIIRGERQQEREEDTGNFHRRERSFGTFTRAFTLPDDVNADQVKATFRQGVLHVAIPKVASPRTNRVQIQVETDTPTSGTTTGTTAGQEGTS